MCLQHLKHPLLGILQDLLIWRVSKACNFTKNTKKLLERHRKRQLLRSKTRTWRKNIKQHMNQSRTVVTWCGLWPLMVLFMFKNVSEGVARNINNLLVAIIGVVISQGTRSQQKQLACFRWNFFSKAKETAFFCEKVWRQKGRPQENGACMLLHQGLGRSDGRGWKKNDRLEPLAIVLSSAMLSGSGLIF